MALLTHGDRKYQGTTRQVTAVELSSLRIERRRLEAGHHEPGICQSNELAFALSGSTATIQTANGVTYRSVIEPGMSCICPAGTFERASGTTSPLECLHIYLPPSLIEHSAIADYDIDPGKAELAYTGAVTDPDLYRFAVIVTGALGKKVLPAGRLFLEGMQAALAAYLLERYSIDRWRHSRGKPDLTGRRIKRVLDYIDAHFSEEVTLNHLAAEANLSEYHLSRAFRETIGVSPRRYLVFRRVQEAQQRLERSRSPSIEIASQTGFGSVEEFIEVFRTVTGLTPDQYRKQRRG